MDNITKDSGSKLTKTPVFWAVAGIIVIGILFGTAMNNGALSSPKGQKGKPSKQQVVTFAANAQLLQVDPENSSVTIFVDAGSYTTKDFKLLQRNAIVDPGAKIFIGDEKVALEDIVGFERAYIFGKQVDKEIHINKIIAQPAQ